MLSVSLNKTFPSFLVPYKDTRLSLVPYKDTRLSLVPYKDTRLSLVPYKDMRLSLVPYKDMRICKSRLFNRWSSALCGYMCVLKSYRVLLNGRFILKLETTIHGLSFPGTLWVSSSNRMSKIVLPRL